MTGALLGYSAAQVRAAEASQLAAGEPLMQRAADGLAGVLLELLADGAPDASRGARGAVLVLAGSGDNGGDAMYAAAAVAGVGIEVLVVATGSRLHEAARAAAIAAGARMADAADVPALARRSAIVVDGIIGTGTGADPALRGQARAVVAGLLPLLVGAGRDAPRVVAVDIPSGIDPTDGRVPDAVVLPADVTVTFGGIKAGLLLSPAAALAGEVRLIDIGIGPALAAVEPVVVRGSRPG